MNLSIYIDDLALDTACDNRLQVVEDAVAAASDLMSYLENDTKLHVSTSKSTVLASSPGVAASIQRALGVPGVLPATVRSLGVDFVAGKKVRPNLLRTRRARYSNMCKRLRRMSMLGSGHHSAPGRIFTTGVLPSVLYDAPVHGLNGRELLKLRRLTAKFLGISGPKRSLDIAFAFHANKDPEVLSTVALMKRFTMEVWDASLPVHIRTGHGIPLGELACQISEYLDKSLHPPVHTYGPLSALQRAMYSHGWEFVSPFVVRTRNNNIINLTQVCPRRTIAWFRRDVMDTIVSRGVNRVLLRSESPEARGILDHGMFMQPLIDLHKKLPHGLAKKLLAWVSGGTFTRMDLVKYGFDVDPACPVCRAAPDTLFHRCFTCRVIEPTVRNNLGNHLLNQILPLGATGLLAGRGFSPNPALEEVPSSVPLVMFHNMSPSDHFDPADGEVFADGSCLSPSVLDLARSGFGLCQVGAGGEVLKGLWGLVPHPLPQTSLAGEVCALWAAVEMCQGCDVVFDCQEVVDSWTKGVPCSAKAFGAHACCFKNITQQYPDWLDRVHRVFKIKAHRTEDQVGDDPIDILRHRGNAAADDFAKKGAALHEAPASDVIMYKAAKRDLRKVAMHVVEVLSSLDCAIPDRLVKLPVGTRLPQDDSNRMSHRFVWQSKSWICTRCFIKVGPLSCHTQRAYSQCVGTSSLDLVLSNRQGHDLWAAHILGDGPLIFCKTCWAFCEAFPRKLKQPCAREVGPFGPTARKRIFKGVHPSDPERKISKPVPVRSFFLS